MADDSAPVGKNCGPACRACMRLIGAHFVGRGGSYTPSRNGKWWWWWCRWWIQCWWWWSGWWGWRWTGRVAKHWNNPLVVCSSLLFFVIRIIPWHPLSIPSLVPALCRYNVSNLASTAPPNCGIHPYPDVLDLYMFLPSTVSMNYWIWLIQNRIDVNKRAPAVFHDSQTSILP